MNIESDDINEIIIRYLGGEASEEEKLAFNNWLLLNEENRKYFSELKEIWHSSNLVLNDPGQFNTNEWDKLQSKLNSPLHLKQSLTNTLQQKIFYYGVAATLIVLLGVGAIIYYLHSSKSNVERLQTYNEVIIPLGKQGQVILEDGTRVWLNSGSSLKYPGHFAGNNREVSLIGEGFFEVKKDKHKPFFVKLSHISVKVLGTKFNVKSYPEDNVIETTLIEGSIKLIETVKSSKTQKEIEIKPNQKATFDKLASLLEIKPLEQQISETIEKKSAKPTQLESIISWKDENLVFNHETLDQIALKLERWYGYKVVIIGSAKTSDTYTGKFINKETISQVLEVIKASGQIEYSIQNKEVIIKIK